MKYYICSMKKNIFKAGWNWFKKAVQKEKPVKLMPEGEIQEERKNPFERQIRKHESYDKARATHTTVFLSELAAKKKRHRKIRNRMQKHSRATNYRRVA